MHSFARLQDELLMQNHFMALAKLIATKSETATKIYTMIGGDHTTLNPYSSKWLKENDIETRQGYVRKLCNEASVVVNADINQVFSFLHSTGVMWSAFPEVTELNEFIANMDRGSWDYQYWGLFICNDCEKYEWDDHATSDWNDDYICRTCVSGYRYSDYYDAYVHREDYRRAIDSSGDECYISSEDCNFEYSDHYDCYVHDDYNGDDDDYDSDNHHSSSTLFRGYHDSKRYQIPIDSDWTKANNNRYFGVELEVESKVDRHGKIDLLHAILNKSEGLGKRCFFESDGSLSNGFEIITQPMGLDMHQDWWKWLLESNLISGLRSHNTSTCGLHIHVSRNGLEELQLNKMITFVNHPDNAQLMMSIARRYDAGYCHIKQKTVQTAQEDVDRYDAVNVCTSGQKTVEFRLFKGTLRYESVMAAIQFVNSLVLFCKEDNFALSTDHFKQFITGREDNNFLFDYIEERMNRQSKTTT